MSYKIGLTGGIGSGKTTIANAFSSMGGAVISADAISHALMQKGESAYLEVVTQFGPRILLQNGEINRALLGDLTFNDSALRARLEGILHPLIMSDMHQRADALEVPYVVLDIPLLIGTPEQNRVDRILVVDCKKETRAERIKQRNDWSEEKINAVMSIQLPDRELLEAADDVIDNNWNIRDIEERVAELHLAYLDLASKSRPVIAKER